MAKLTKAQHEWMRHWYIDLFALGREWQPTMSKKCADNLAKMGLVEMSDLNSYLYRLTEAGLAYCREHFGKEAQNA